MIIPPIPPTSFQYAPANQPDPVQQFLTDWNAWKVSPDMETSKTLLDFLTQNRIALTATGETLPCPFPYKESFAQCYQNAMDKLSNFIQQGCPQSSVQDSRIPLDDVGTWLNPPNPFLQTFYNDWHSWYLSPNLATATTLSDFLTDNKAKIFAMGDKLPCPMPPPYNSTFAQCYNAAVDNLSRYIHYGCPPVGVPGVSEWIANLYDWLHQ